MQREHERAASERVEWLAALWQLTEREEPRCANPHLLTLLRYAPRLAGHPALEAFAALRRLHSRDQLIKTVVTATCDPASAHGDLADTLAALANEDEELLGAGPHGMVAEARAEVQRRAARIAGVLDPAADLAAVTGERLSLRVVLAPSVFLPPPQAGRHGVLVRGSAECVAHLHFGFPLLQDPQQFSITRPWLVGGAWHYAIQLYLERHWPGVAERLAPRADLAAAVSQVMGPGEGRAGRPWTDVLQAHLNVALKCLLSRRLGLPDGVHRAFARARGLVLFPWFADWLLDGDVAGRDLAAHIATLPEAFAGARAQWERLAGSTAGLPPTVNLALISPGTRRASLVIPDEWSEAEADAAVAGWRLLPLPVVRYGAWAAARTGAQTPVIALGEPERNPLVRRVLEQRALSLDPLASDPAIIALSRPGFEPATWCVAVAVSRPETAAGLRMEMALKQTSSYIVFDRGRVVALDRLPLDQLGAAVPRLSSLA